VFFNGVVFDAEYSQYDFHECGVKTGFIIGANHLGFGCFLVMTAVRVKY
jgi:hypothetical protein